MRNFVVFAQGENFTLEVDGKLQPAGFFASRRIEAETEEEASKAVITQLLKEPELEGKALPDYHKYLHKSPRKNFSRFA